MDINALVELVGQYSLILIPITLGVTEIAKRFLPDAFITKGTPLISLVIGIISSVLIAGMNRQSILVGIIIGLSASGLWSAAVSPFKKKDTEISNPTGGV